MFHQESTKRYVDVACLVFHPVYDKHVQHIYVQNYGVDCMNSGAYHTSFYEGSSGAPVLNDRGQVVYLHNKGMKPGPEASDRDSPRFVFELGVIMAAIREDLKTKLQQSAVPVFDNRQVMEMDTT